MVVVNFDRRVDAQDDRHGFGFAVGAMNHERDLFQRIDAVFDAVQLKRLAGPIDRLLKDGIDYCDRTVSMHEAAHRAVAKIQGEAA